MIQGEPGAVNNSWQGSKVDIHLELSSLEGEMIQTEAEAVKDLAKPTVVILIFPCPNCKTIVSTQDVDVFGKCPECEYDFEEVEN